MAHRNFAAHEFNFTRDSEIFIDTNIWLYIQGPFVDHTRWATKYYSDIYKRILEQKSHVYYDVMVLSEFINRCVRFYHSLAKQSDQTVEDYKSFRKSPDFEKIARGVCDDARIPLGFHEQLTFDFLSFDLEACLGEFEKGALDFTDHVIADICKSRNLLLLTNDADYAGCDIQILSGNRKLLV